MTGFAHCLSWYYAAVASADPLLSLLVHQCLAHDVQSAKPCWYCGHGLAPVVSDALSKRSSLSHSRPGTSCKLGIVSRASMISSTGRRNASTPPRPTRSRCLCVPYHTGRSTPTRLKRGHSGALESSGAVA